MINKIYSEVDIAELTNSVINTPLSALKFDCTFLQNCKFEEKSKQKLFEFHLYEVLHS